MGSVGNKAVSVVEATKSKMKKDLKEFSELLDETGRSEAAKDTRKLARKLEQNKEQNENRKIVQEAKREQAKGVRNWSPKEGQKISNVGPDRAKNELFNAPVGTVIQMDRHQSGDYVGEYTKTKNGWVGSQKYRSSFKTPSTVKTPEGFSMHVTGNDIKVIKVGKRKRNKK